MTYTVTSVICYDKYLSDYFEEALKVYDKNPLGIANWIANDLLREMSGSQEKVSWQVLKITPNAIAELVKLIDDKLVSKQSAKDVFLEMFRTGKHPRQIIQEKGLEMKVDMEVLRKMCEEVIAENPKPVAQFKSGKEKAINVLKGQMMRKTQGKAPVDLIDQLLLEKLKS